MSWFSKIRDRQRIPDLTINSETERRIELLFAPAEQPEVRSLLSECGKIGGFREDDVERVRFAALKLSDGDLHKLRSGVELARIDFRDALMASGFGYSVTAHRDWVPEKKW